MEPSKDSLRLIVNLGKYQVVKVDKGTLGTSFTLALPNNVTIRADLPYPADVRIGDLLTIYTEVLSNVFPTDAPIQ